MLTSERHQFILSELKDKGVIKVQALTESLATSESTIRRDLAQLEAEHLLRRVHGGAERVEQKNFELTMTEKESKHIKEKRAIASYAASLIRKDDCIFIDAGTTTLQLIEALPQKKITIVTNGIRHMQLATEKGFETYIVGGRAKSATGAIVGRAAQKSLQQYRFDKSFIGTNGIDAHAQFTTPDPDEALIKELAHTLANETYVLADASKFNHVFFTQMFALSEANIITNQLNEETSQIYHSLTNVKEVGK